jgi:hypothetical protein
MMVYVQRGPSEGPWRIRFYSNKEPVMLEDAKPFCPECEGLVEQPDGVDRRDFMRVVGRTAAAVTLGGVAARVPATLAADDKTKPAEKAAKPAEDLVKELFASLDADQKKAVVLPWDYTLRGSKTPARLGMYNAAIEKRFIGDTYTKAQQELIERILKAISSGEEGYKQISRNGTWDMSASLEKCGALIFGDVAEGKKYSWVFTGHHLTVRCDGNSEEGAAFGGPMYYGHSPNGYSRTNVFNYQTRSVLNVFDALSEKQRKVAVLQLDKKAPNEGAASVKLRTAKDPKPGLSYGEMNKDQRELVETVMRDVLSPYRKEDADEVMQIIKTNGGLEKIHLAFYQDMAMNDNNRWHFWRLVGPGFVWNYRVLPHVHTYVNISSKV